nr:phospholipase SGR2 [Tanacetum cinerariifolium]
MAENDLAAALPLTEVVGKGDYFRFGMRDSLAIEASFLQREEELLSNWWREYGECRIGPKGSLPSISESDPASYDLATTRNKLYSDEEERVGVPVKGGLYELFLMAESSGKGEEGRRRTAADMLRNTPSNIRRLIDEGFYGVSRKVKDSRVRTSLDLAAALPLTEVVGKGDYFRFGMRDSLAIEASFLQREEELLSNWWREYDEEERVGVPVKGGLYEVDLLRRHSFPVYWNGDNRRVLRGHWFARKGSLDWFPLREDVAEQLEFAYRSRGLHAIFTGEDDTWDAWLNIPSSGFSGIVNLGGTGIKLRRGYAPSHSPKPTQDELRQQKEEEMDDYCSQDELRQQKEEEMDDYCSQGFTPVNVWGWFWLCLRSKGIQNTEYYSRRTWGKWVDIFMVHGIGQRLQKANLVDDVGTFHQLTQNLADLHLTSYQRETQRVLFIPCQWRKDLKLSSESAVEKCTLPGLRVTLSATVHGVSNQLNRSYIKFLKRNPGYDGKVSLYGHSLGSVLSFDILCHQDTLSSSFPMEWMYKDHNNEIAPECDSSFNYAEKDSIANKVVIDTLASTSDGNVSAATNFEKQDSPDLVEAGAKSDDSPTDMHTEKIASLDECTGVNSQVVTSNSNEIEEETVKNDESTDIDEETDKNDESIVIKSLKEEVDSLNAKIKELESQRIEENKQEASDTRNGSVSESSPSSKNNSMKSYTPVIKYTKLMFKVDTFFAVGSPLGVFLALRNVRIGIGKGKDYWEDENIIEEMPSCRQMFNIFHPYDPVAYRVEPLVCKEYLDKRAVIIPYHRGGKRLHVGYQEFVEGVASRSQVVVDQMSVAKVKNKTFEHQYISAVGAHTKYWRDPDTALFILKHLYRDIPKAPYIQNKHSEITTNQENNDWKEMFDDEELPLTFASEDFLKQFSVGVKKFTNK